MRVRSRPPTEDGIAMAMPVSRIPGATNTSFGPLLLGGAASSPSQRWEPVVFPKPLRTGRFRPSWTSSERLQTPK